MTNRFVESRSGWKQISLGALMNALPYIVDPSTGGGSYRFKRGNTRLPKDHVIIFFVSITPTVAEMIPVTTTV